MLYKVLQSVPDPRVEVNLPPLRVITSPDRLLLSRSPNTGSAGITLSAWFSDTGKVLLLHIHMVERRRYQYSFICKQGQNIFMFETRLQVHKSYIVERQIYDWIQRSSVRMCFHRIETKRLQQQKMCLKALPRIGSCYGLVNPRHPMGEGGILL